MTVYRRALAVALLALAALLPSVASALTYTSSNGRVVFSTGSGSTTPSAKPYTTSSSTFGAAIQLPAGAANQAGFVLKNAPLRDEYLAGYVTTAGMLYVLRYNGATSSWSSEWSVNVGGDGVNGRRFDIAYEKATGRGMVDYSAITANAAMHYRVWDPATATWGTEQSFGSDHISGVANVVKLASQPNTSRIAVGVVDASSYLTAFIWNGSAWGSEPGYSLSAYPLLSVSTPGDMESFDLAFGSLAGDLMVAWSAKGASPVLYTNRYQASGGWLASTYNMGSAGIGVAEVVVAADPQSDQMGLVFSSKKLWFGFPVTSLAGYIWTGSTWSSLLSFGTLTSAVVSGSPPPDVPRQRPFTAFWLCPNGSYSLLVIHQSD